MLFKGADGKTWQDVTDLSWIATMGKRAGIYWSNYGKGGATTKSYITDKLPTVLSGQAKDFTSEATHAETSRRLSMSGHRESHYPEWSWNG